MAGWFARLMQSGRRSAATAVAGDGLPRSADVGRNLAARDARYDAVVRMLRDRDAEDRAAREKRQRFWYRQSLESDAGIGRGTSPSSPLRLHRFRTKVSCRATPEARALLDRLRLRYAGSAVSFRHVSSGRQAVMLTGGACTEPTQIGWVEQSVQPDPTLCNLRHQGLAIETDGDAMLVLRFRYPATAVRMSSRQHPEVAAPVSFTETRLALEPRLSEKASSPRLVWVTRAESETMNALQSREYEAFYLRFKLEVQAGIWSSLSALLSVSPDSQWHCGSHYTVVRRLDATNRRIHQSTIDDAGRPVDIGLDRIYDAAPATDILLLYLEGDILADFADIYFTLQSLSSADAYALKEEFFTVIRRFWGSAQSIASRFGSDLAAVVRMSLRAVPVPSEALLKQDWTKLRQSLVDRYGEGGRTAGDLVGQHVHRPRAGPPAWPFASFPAGEINLGLRLVYRQEWKFVGDRRGEVIRALPSAATQPELPRTYVTPGTATRRLGENVRRIETTVERGSADATSDLGHVVEEARNAAVEAMKWPLDLDGGISTGVRALGTNTEADLASESRERSRDLNTRLTDIMRTMSSHARDSDVGATPPDAERGLPSPSSREIGTPVDQDADMCVYSRLQKCYEILTRPVEIHNVVLVAERLPTPTEIGRSWVRRHDWILGKVLLDESFRGALDTIGEDVDPASDESGHLRLELDAKRDDLYEHIRANILHYQRSIWRQEDPQQRSMRYRKLGKKVPLEWRFELASGGTLTVDDLYRRLSGANVDAQFAAYSTGREADLDQVIDPAGPVAYYGNYAIYHMRPEFGSADLFSMLHFFKSPFLRPDAETGAPEVVDPAQLETSDDMFRNERAVRVTLDTESVVVDLIRDADAATAQAPMETIDPPDERGYQLILDGVPGLALLASNGQGDRGAEWPIVRTGEGTLQLLAGSGSGVSHAPYRVADHPIHVRGHGPPALRMLAGGGAALAHGAAAERLILSRDNGAGTPASLVARGGAVSVHELVIGSREDEWLRPSPVAGFADAPSPPHQLLAGP